MVSEVERLRALLAEATPGPWRTSVGRRGAAALAAERPGLLLAEVFTHGDYIFAERHQNADLIAAAVNALPALLDVAEAARRLRDDLKHQQLRWVSDEYDQLNVALDRLDGTS